jgi:hypothetical protein
MSLINRSCSPQRGLVISDCGSYSRGLWEHCGKHWEGEV